MNEDKLREKLTEAYLENFPKGMKHMEIAYQKVIEQEFNEIWWKVCKVPIFNRMFIDGVDPEDLITEIIESCKTYSK